MIALPFNDQRCLGSITEVIAALVQSRDPLIVEIAKEHRTTEGLVSWIRSLPQRDDDGEKQDGPKVAACSPPQRLRIPAPDPNCVERAALYLAAAEMIDPHPVRQLATLDLAIGLHTFPVENGAPVILDPRLPRNGADAALAASVRQPVAVDVHEAIEMTARMGETGAANLRNGPSRVRAARNAMMRLVDEGAAPVDAGEIDAMGWLLALAERVARRYGDRALAIVRTTAQAIADLTDQAIARAQRNLAIEVAGKRLQPAPWLWSLGRAAANVGVDVGAVALRAKLAELGMGQDVVHVIEEELNREGLTMGKVARPPQLPTLANLFKRPAA